MQAIKTTYFGHTNTKPARIKATCSRGSLYMSVHSGKMIQSIAGCDELNHRIAAQELINKFVIEDGGPIKSKWHFNLATGQLPNMDYVHVLIYK